jgi:uncharacterized protein YbbK (DUF523 family)
MPAPATSPPSPESPVKPRIGVSSCLLGEPVRFNGGHSRCRFLTDELGSHVDWVPFCPEIAIGLGSPRQTLRLTTNGRLVNREGTADHTAAVAALPLPTDLDGYVFKAKSPTCGLHGIARYRDDTHPAGHRGRGAFAQRLTEAFPFLPAEDEGRLNDPALREAFIERIFASARLRALLSSPWLPHDLIRFHARHKLQLLAHDPAHSQLAGQVTAHAGAKPTAKTAAAYRQLFIPQWPASQPADATPTRCCTPSATSASTWTRHAGPISWTGSKPTGAATHRSASPSRCSATTPTATRSPGSPSRPTSPRSPTPSASGTASNLTSHHDGSRPFSGTI